jgi:hypothetical protein
MAMSDTPLGASAAAAPLVETSYVDWPAIFAGAVLSLAISFVLLTFGSALGLSFGDNPNEDYGIGFFLAAGLWLLWVQTSACIAGGYLAGRLRRRKHDATEEESDVRDGAHGLVVWGLGVLVGSFIVVSGLASVASTAASAIGSAAGTAATGAATGAAALAGTSVDGADLNGAIDRYLRGNGTAESVAPEGTREEVGRILSSLSDGEVSAADRQYLAQSLAARTGIDQPTAEARVNDLVSSAQTAINEAKEAADTARKAALIAAFAVAASFFIAAVGAYYGATLGGNHRDKGTYSNEWIPSGLRTRRW